MDTDTSCLREDFTCLADFRVERLRRQLKAGRKPAQILASRVCRHLGALESQFVLGWAYAHWDERAHGARGTRWMRRAALQGHYEANGCWWARRAPGSWAERLPALRCAAEAGDHDALRALVYLCEIWDEAPVIAWVGEQLEKGAQRGELFALRMLAKGHTRGLFGLHKDDDKAFALWSAVAQRDDPQGHCALGTHYATGRGTARDLDESVRRYELAARGGNDWGMYFLGYSCHVGRGKLGPSMREANRWYRRAALRGHPAAQFELGLSLLLGHELPANAARANSFFARAARAGHIEATFSLARSYHDRRGVPQSFEKAAKLYAVAAKAGHKPSQLELAELLRYGVGVEKNVAEAERWLRAANEPTPQ